MIAKTNPLIIKNFYEGEGLNPSPYGFEAKEKKKKQ